MTNKNIKTLSITIISIFVFVCIIVIGASMGKSKDKNGDTTEGADKGDKIEKQMSLEDAQAELKKMAEEVGATKGELIKASVDLSESSLANEVPPIDEYPLSVTSNADIVIEIFATSEKSGSGKDGWINDIAIEFNKQGYKTADGKTIGVNIRPMASGLGSDYIVSKVYLPTAYTPSNELFGSITMAQGGEIKLAEPVLVKNTAGVLISSKVYDKIKSKYDDVNIQTIIRATEENVIAMGYTNPLSSATGLNFLVTTLYMYDENDILSAEATEGFRNFQNNVPYVAYTTLQMRESAKSGSLSGMVMEYQTYINDEELSNNYTFIPFGVAHNNPLYSVGELSSDEQYALDEFIKYCKADNAQSLATQYGFNQYDYNVTVDISKFSNRDIVSAQDLWKENKDLDKDIIAVFVADVSGSMSGDPINQLKASLTNGMKYIGDNVQVGLVSYSSAVSIDLPIGKFDLNQRAYFQGAVEKLYPNGGTASYDALVVAAQMIEDAKTQNPNAKVMLFLLSDGQCNEGYTLDDISTVMDLLDVPICTIAYGKDADKDELGRLSSINEAATINANSDDVVYKIKSLFNSEM